ncbi:MAG: hypothetical protein JJU10_08540 [Idiomarina sp.]|nr:hypothetical protein [Idiomarina sp.]
MPPIEQRLKAFYWQHKDSPKTLESALAQSDQAALFALLHALKGAAAILPHPRLHEACSKAIESIDCIELENVPDVIVTLRLLLEDTRRQYAELNEEQLLSRLARLIQQHNLEALQLSATMMKQDQSPLSANEAETIHSCLKRFDFSQAARYLEEVMTSSSRKRT